ncbi:MAG: hypothetical protein IJ097_02485 [Bacilli bacterium]|nr:hypothetical protein [Bacilli bacterium]
MEEIDLKELFNYYKGKIAWMIIIVLTITILGNTYRLITRKPLYRSDTSIVLVSANENGSSLNELQVNKNLVSTYSEIIRSRKVLDPVISNLELDYSYNKLKSNISVAAVGDTQIIRITVSDEKPKLAAKIADEIADVFSKEVKEIYKLNNVAVVDKAVEAAKPYNINYIKDNIIFLGAGIILAFGIIFVIYYFDTSIKTSEEIENKLGLTVIGMVPKMDNN